MPGTGQEDLSESDLIGEDIGLELDFDTGEDPPPPAPTGTTTTPLVILEPVEVAWLRELRIILRTQEEDRTLELGITESIESATEEERRQIAEAIRLSLEEKARRDKEIFDETWGPVRRRVDHFVDSTPVPEGIQLLQSALAEIANEVEELGATDPETATGRITEVENTLEVSEGSWLQWVEAMEEVRKKRNVLDRRRETMESRAETAKALAPPLEQANMAREEIQRRLAALDPTDATKALPDYARWLDRGDELWEEFGRSKGAYEKRLAYVTQRLPAAQGDTTLKPTLDEHLEQSQTLLKFGRIEGALSALDLLIEAVRGAINHRRRKVSTLEDEAFDVPMKGVGLTGATPPVYGEAWAEAIEAKLKLWDLVAADDLLDKFAKDLKVGIAALPRGRSDVGDLTDLEGRAKALEIRNAANARNTEMIRSTALRLIGPDGTLRLDMSELAGLPTVDPSDLTTLSREISEGKYGDLPGSHHALRLLRKLRDDEALRNKLESIGAPDSQDGPSARMIRSSLGLGSDVEVTAAHARQAALAGLLSHTRQGGAGSCFATSVAVQIQTMRPDLFLDDMKELLEKGTLTRTISGRVVSMPMSTEQLEGGVTKELTVPRQERALEKDPGVSAALLALGIPVDEHKAKLERIIDEPRWKKAIKAGLDAVRSKLPSPDPSAAVTLRALESLRDGSFAQAGDALEAALVAEGVSLSSVANERRHRQRLAAAKQAANLADPPDGSDKVVIGDILEELAKTATDPTKALKDAKDAFLAQEDNRLQRTWEYTLASMGEHAAGPKLLKLQRGASEAMWKALHDARRPLKAGKTSAEKDDLKRIANRLSDVFDELFKGVDSRYDPNVKSRPAADGHSSSGGFCLFYKGEKIVGGAAYRAMSLELLQKAHDDTFQGTGDEAFSLAIVNAVGGLVSDPSYIDRARDKSIGDVNQPWMVAGGGLSSELRTIYHGGPVTTMKSTDDPGAPIDTGGKLLGYLGRTLRSMAPKLAGLRGNPDKGSALVPVGTDPIHDFSLLAGGKLLERFSQDTTKTVDEHILDFTRDETAKNDARKDLALTDAIALSLLKSTFGDRDAGARWTDFKLTGRDRTVRELTAWSLEYSAAETARWGRMGEQNMFASVDLRPTDSVAAQARIAQPLNPALTAIAWEKLLDGVPNPVAVRQEVERLAPVNPTLAQLAQLVADQVTPPRLDDTALSVFGPLAGDQLTALETNALSPGVLARIKADVFQGWEAPAITTVMTEIEDHLGHAPGTVKEFFDALAAVRSDWVTGDGAAAVATGRNTGCLGTVPADDRLRRAMLKRALGRSLEPHLDEADDWLKAALPPRPTVDDVAANVQGAVAQARTLSALYAFIGDRRTALVTGAKRDEVIREFLDGEPGWIADDVTERVTTAPVPQDVLGLVEKCKRCLSEVWREAREGWLDQGLLAPELTVIADDELDATVKKAASRFGLEATDTTAVVNAVRLAVSAKLPIALPVLEPEISKAIKAQVGKVGLAQEAEVRKTVEAALKKLGVTGTLESEAAERASGLLGTHLPASGKEIAAAVAEAVQLVAVGQAVDGAMEALAVAGDRRFAVRHQTILRLEKLTTPIDLAAIQKAVADVMTEIGVAFERGALDGALDTAAGARAKAKVSATELGDMEGVAEGAVDASLHETLTGSIPMHPGAFADTNWGDGDERVFFGMVINPRTGDPQVWNMSSSGKITGKLSEKEWIKDAGYWDVMSDPDEYGGVL